MSGILGQQHHALQAPRVQRDRSDPWIDELQERRSDSATPAPRPQIRTNDMSPRTARPESPPVPAAACTAEPERPINRHERRALAALQRRRAA